MKGSQASQEHPALREIMDRCSISPRLIPYLSSIACGNATLIKEVSDGVENPWKQSRLVIEIPACLLFNADPNLLRNFPAFMHAIKFSLNDGRSPQRKHVLRLSESPMAVDNLSCESGVGVDPNLRE